MLSGFSIRSKLTENHCWLRDPGFLSYFFYLSVDVASDSFFADELIMFATALCFTWHKYNLCLLYQELEYFRGQHRAAMNQLEVSAQEASTLRGKYGDLLNDNQR